MALRIRRGFAQRKTIIETGQGNTGAGQCRAGQRKLMLSQNTGGLSGIPQSTLKTSHQSRPIRSNGETGDILSEQ